jgi:hypothetical protein
MKLVTVSTAPELNLKTLSNTQEDRAIFDKAIADAISSIETYIVLGDTYTPSRGKEFKLGLPTPEKGKEGQVHRLCMYLEGSGLVQTSGQHLMLHEFSLSNLDTGAMAVRVMGCQSKHRAALQASFRADHSEGLYKARYYA